MRQIRLTCVLLLCLCLLFAALSHADFLDSFNAAIDDVKGKVGEVTNTVSGVTDTAAQVAKKTTDTAAQLKDKTMTAKKNITDKKDSLETDVKKIGNIKQKKKEEQKPVDQQNLAETPQSENPPAITDASSSGEAPRTPSSNEANPEMTQPAAEPPVNPSPSSEPINH